MKMITMLAVFVLLIGTLANAQSKKVDIKKSEIEWNAKKVTGEHSGNILFQSGILEFDGDKLTGGEFVVDMTSITNSDIESDEYKQKLIGHLKSDDFFSVSTYPTSKLILSSVKPMGDGYHVKGKLTIKGKTHPIEFHVNEKAGLFSGTMTVDRTKYDVRYGSDKFFDDLGDKMIYDEFTLTFDVATK